MNIVYPRTFRVTYREDWAQNPIERLVDAHSDDDRTGMSKVSEPMRPPLVTRDVNCHTYRTDSAFVHFSIIKRYDEQREIPVWMNVLSIPYGLVSRVELIHDDAEKMVPMQAVDLNELVKDGPHE